MNTRPLTYFAVAVAALLPVSTEAGYQIDLAPEFFGSQSRFQAAPAFGAYPRITSMSRDGLPSNAATTISSPAGRFTGKWPDRSGTSTYLSDTQSVLDAVNGTWTIAIEDSGQLFQYQFDVGLQFPFADLPYFTSSTLVNGKEVGLFDWTLHGGSSVFPGGLAVADLYTSGFGSLIDSRYGLPVNGGNWLPNGDLTGATEYYASVNSYSGTIDTSSFTVFKVMALTPGAPELSFGPVKMTYTAFLQATLVRAVIPEPAGLALAVIASLPAYRRRCH
jgi:hypothetical protein